jgi:hypothetical protein
MELRYIDCKEKECMRASMNGTFFCDNGVCREIGRKFNCSMTDNYEEETRNCNGLIMCERLTGVYDCIKNQCRKLLIDTHMPGYDPEVDTPITLKVGIEKNDLFFL